MEACPIPTEVCKFIIDTVGEVFHGRQREETLRRCALTCCAWRTRAQRCLWEAPFVRGRTSINIFLDATRHDSGFLASHIHSLHLYLMPKGTADQPPVHRLNGLLLTSKLPNLRVN
ncbi:hypothetical protein BC628DRAFT_839413 [Trametes gibbosa]|nr:hypothetical protein BC628DRAFT_839413 [Trametes gibbosa]